METQPRSAHRPEARMYTVDRDGVAPEVSIVMDNETACSVEILRQSAAVLAGIVDEIEQWLVQLRQVAHFRGPVVHLGIYVDRVLAVPRGLHLVVPLALKVCRHRPGAAACDQKVSAEVKIK